jgi:peptidoglycan/LPS O-acetylase OafA/YrhL
MKGESVGGREKDHSKSTVRADIQGLRALAVLAVVADHTFAWPSGGFVGVDIFFVISGFLITGLLLKEFGTTDAISFGDFYRRRIRRIIPAAVVVLTATVLLSRLLLSPSQFMSVAWDAVASAFFAANWRFIGTGTDYFTASGPVSPLQHFWSLAVEEQFYLVWPWLLLLCLAISARVAKNRRSGRLGAGIAVGVLGLGSLGWAFAESASSPTVAYFSTATRAWELAVGAGLALLVPVLSAHLMPWLRVALAWTGLAGCLASLFLVSESSGFPAPGALLPVLAAAMIVASGVGGPYRGPWPLRNRVAGYVGDISYSLYLWHFPVVIILVPYLGHLLGPSVPAIAVEGLGVAISIGLAALTYAFVEDKIRRSRWLEPTRRPGRRRRGPRARKASPVVVLAAMAASIALVVAAMSFNALNEPTAKAGSASGRPVPATTTTPTPGGSAAPDALAQLSKQIAAAVQAKKWPDTLTPSVADVSGEQLPGNAGSCGGPTMLPADQCTFGDPNAPHKAVLVGDSIAQAYVPALAAIFGSGDWTLRITSMYACPFVDLKIGNVPKAADLCAARRAQEVEAITSAKPELVLVASTYLRGVDVATGAKATAADWASAFTRQLQQIKGVGTTVLLTPPPYEKDTAACYTPYSSPSDCLSRVGSSYWQQMAMNQQAQIKKLGGVFVDTSRWFCTSSGVCPAFVGTTLVKKDAYHPTVAYMNLITPAITETFQKLGILDGHTAPAK